MKILVTGFEPFDGNSVNPSEQVVKRLVEYNPIEKVKLETLILPVDQFRAPVLLLNAIDEGNPQAVICLGEAQTRAAISIERVAVNLMDFRIADNCGNLVVDEEIIPGGPAAFFTTLPVRDMYDEIKTHGVPVELSLSAGAFLCNQVMYRLLHHLKDRQPQIPAGFIHLPRLPEQAARNTIMQPSMSIETSTLGITIAIQILAKKISENPGPILAIGENL